MRKDPNNIDEDESVALSDLSSDMSKLAKKDPLVANKKKRMYLKKIKLRKCGEIYRKQLAEACSDHEDRSSSSSNGVMQVRDQFVDAFIKDKMSDKCD